MNIPGGWELILILAVFTLLFGAKRMPDAARSLGRSMRIFKAETKGLRDDDNDGLDDRTGKPMPNRTEALPPGGVVDPDPLRAARPEADPLRAASRSDV